MHEIEQTAIVDLMEREADMTIATIRPDGLPHATTVSYVSEGLILYFGTSPSSQKAINIESNSNVSLTINSPYRFWRDIAGLSISGVISRVEDAEEFRKVGKLLYEKYPQVNEFAKAETENVALYRVEPQVICHLDYRKGFGHKQLHVL